MDEMSSELRGENNSLPSTSAAVGGVNVASTSASTSTEVSRRNESTAVCDNVGKKEEQQQKKDMLPDEVWGKILENVDDNSVTAFASVCKQLRHVQRESGRRLRTNLRLYSKTKRGEKIPWEEYSESTVSEDWCLWSMSTLASTNEEKKTRRLMQAAALRGHLNLLKHGKAQSGDAHEVLFGKETCALAAYGGHLHVLMWLRENNCPWDIERTSQHAARGGRLEVLKYTRDNGYTWNERTCWFAAQGGQLELLEYLRDHDCPWDELTCKAASFGGHLELLKYARENGCP